MFKKEFWTSSAGKLKSVRYLALMALFIAMKSAMSGLFIPVAENLRISVTFLVTSVEAAILGPVAGMVSGAITDLVGFMMFPTGPFFPGYTLSAMIGILVYSLFFYEQKITVLKLFLAKFINNYFTNVLLGSLWSAMMYGKAYLYYAGKSIVKNTLMLPIEVVMLVVVFNLMIPILQNRKLIGRYTQVPLKIK